MKKTIFYISILLVSLTVKSQSIKETITINDSTNLILVQKSFKPDKHTILYSNDGLILLIDSYMVYGTDAIMPKNSLKKAELVINGKVYCLETKGMFDPEIQQRDIKEFSINTTYSGYILRAIFSYGAGIYGVEWKIIDDKSYRTIITNDWKIIDKDFIDEKAK